MRKFEGKWLRQLGGREMHVFEWLYESCYNFRYHVLVDIFFTFKIYFVQMVADVLLEVVEEQLRHVVVQGHPDASCSCKGDTHTIIETPLDQKLNTISNP